MRIWDGIAGESDVRAATGAGIDGIADPADRERVAAFFDLVGGQHTVPALFAAARAAVEQRTPSLADGWRKVVLVQTGIMGMALEDVDERSHEIVKWSYDGLKELGFTLDDVDSGRPIGQLMFDLNQAAIRTWVPEMPPAAPPTPKKKRRWFGG